MVGPWAQCLTKKITHKTARAWLFDTVFWSSFRPGAGYHFVCSTFQRKTHEKGLTDCLVFFLWLKLRRTASIKDIHTEHGNEHELHHWRRALARNAWKKTFQNFSVCCAKANGHWPFSPNLLPWPKKSLQPRNSWGWFDSLIMWNRAISSLGSTSTRPAALRVASSRCRLKSLSHDITWLQCGSISWISRL